MFCYIDDIFIYSKNLEEHERHVQLILDKLKEVGFYAKLEKHEFHKIEVEFLDYVVFGDGIRTDPYKIQTIVNWATLAELFVMFNVLFGSPTFIEISLHVIL